MRTPWEDALSAASITVGGVTAPLVELSHALALFDTTTLRVFRHDRGHWLEEEYPSIEEAQRTAGMVSDLCALAAGTLAWVDCRECGQRDRLRYVQSTTRRLYEQRLCFTCGFWMEKLDLLSDPTVARINGRHYVVGAESAGDKRFNGFGGRRFVVLFDDGRRVVTTNLWTQGEIPELFRGRLPDNARFEEQATAIRDAADRIREALK